MNCYCLFHVLDAAAALFIGVGVICNSLLKITYFIKEIKRKGYKCCCSVCVCVSIVQ